MWGTTRRLHTFRLPELAAATCDLTTYNRCRADALVLVERSASGPLSRNCHGQPFLKSRKPILSGLLIFNAAGKSDIRQVREACIAAHLMCTKLQIRQCDGCVGRTLSPFLTDVIRTQRCGSNAAASSPSVVLSVTLQMVALCRHLSYPRCTFRVSTRCNSKASLTSSPKSKP